jgi:hypothetical protein
MRAQHQRDDGNARWIVISNSSAVTAPPTQRYFRSWNDTSEISMSAPPTA